MIKMVNSSSVHKEECAVWGPRTKVFPKSIQPSRLAPRGSGTDGNHWPYRTSLGRTKAPRIILRFIAPKDRDALVNVNSDFSIPLGPKLGQVPVFGLTRRRSDRGDCNTTASRRELIWILGERGELGTLDGSRAVPPRC